MKPLPPQFNNSHTPETTAQQALAEFGITELLSRLKHYRDIDFDASQMHLTDAEVKILAKLFIQELIQSLNGKLIAGTLNTLRHGEEMEEHGEPGEQCRDAPWRVWELGELGEMGKLSVIGRSGRLCRGGFHYYLFGYTQM
ncbi:hypothetical protein [Coleofasciculus sp.]|uniref:hypothetical protein n=1 Tax=Coleofasciculus sp. TaxID=3100458 RepID=UPI003A4650E7